MSNIFDWNKAYFEIQNNTSSESIEENKMNLLISSATTETNELRDKKFKINDIRRYINSEIRSEIFTSTIESEEFKHEINTIKYDYFLWINSVLRVKDNINRIAKELTEQEKKELLKGIFNLPIDVNMIFANIAESILKFNGTKEDFEKLNTLVKNEKIKFESLSIDLIMPLLKKFSETYTKEDFDIIMKKMFNHRVKGLSEKEDYSSELVKILRKTNYSDEEILDRLLLLMKKINVNYSMVDLKETILQNFDITEVLNKADNYFSGVSSIINNKETNELILNKNMKDSEEFTIYYNLITEFDMNVTQKINESLVEKMTETKKNIKKNIKMMNFVKNFAKKYDFNSILNVPLMNLEEKEIMCLRELVREVRYLDKNRVKAEEIKNKYKIDINLDKFSEIFHADQEERIKRVKEYNKFIDIILGLNDVNSYNRSLEDSLSFDEKNLNLNEKIIGIGSQLFQKHLDKWPVLGNGTNNTVLTNMQREFVSKHILNSYILINTYLEEKKGVESLFYFDSREEKKQILNVVLNNQSHFAIKKNKLREMKNIFFEENLYLKKTFVELSNKKSLTGLHSIMLEHCKRDINGISENDFEKERKNLIEMMKLFTKNEVNDFYFRVKEEQNVLAKILLEELISLEVDENKGDYFKDFLNKREYFKSLDCFKKDEEIVDWMLKELNTEYKDFKYLGDVKLALHYILSDDSNYDYKATNKTIEKCSKDLNIEQFISKTIENDIAYVMNLSLNHDLFTDEKIWQNKDFVLGVGSLLDKSLLKLETISKAPENVFSVFMLIENKNKREGGVIFSEDLRKLFLKNELENMNKVEINRGKKKI